jgi:hypothetical protein
MKRFIKAHYLNPIEILVLIGMLSVLAHSIYSVFWGWTSIHPENFQSSNSPAWERHHAGLQNPERSIASSSVDYQSLSIACDRVQLLKTDSNKIRLNGSFCGPMTNPSIKISFNKSNSQEPSVFYDLKAQRFSTSYFSLEPGENHLSVKLGGNQTSAKGNNLQVTIFLKNESHNLK